MLQKLYEVNIIGLTSHDSIHINKSSLSFIHFLPPRIGPSSGGALLLLYHMIKDGAD